MRSLAAPGLALLLAACATGGPTTKVLTAPPSAPIAAFALAPAEVQSREVGEAAWARNGEYGAYVTALMRQALQDKGKSLVDPPADTIRMRVYLAAGEAPIRVRGDARAGTYVEVRLQLQDADGAVRYSTHTRAPLPATAIDEVFGADRDALVREALRAATQDFVSRL